MKKARNVILVLCIAATAVISLFINSVGGFALAFLVESSSDIFYKCGVALLISSAFLVVGTVFACFQKVWVPLIFNIIGTACYIYTVSGIYSIPNEMRPKADTEPLAERHLLTVFVTILLAILVFLNYFSEKNAEKRNKKRAAKYGRDNRKLSDNEKIL